MIIDLKEYRKNQTSKDPETPGSLTTDWHILGWGQNADMDLLFNFTLNPTILESAEFFVLLDPRDVPVIGFPEEEECWEACTDLIGVSSVVVMKKLGWRVQSQTILIEK